MNTKLISIIIPVYNAEQYLDMCLTSVCNQTYTNLEIIVVNDGSSDCSLDIIKKYAKQDSRIIVLNQKNQGVSYARNSGLEIATGEYIIFLDSDDWITNDCCEAAFREAESSKADVVFWSYIREYEKKSKTTLLFDDAAIHWNSQNIKKLYKRMIGLTGEELKQPQKIDSLITVWGKLYKKSIIGDIRFVDTNIIGTDEDALFNIQVFTNVKSATYIPKAMLHYRKYNMNSMTHYYKKNLVSQWLELYKWIELYLDKNYADEECYHALSNRICLGLIGLGMNLAEDTRMSFGEKRRELKNILTLPHYQKALAELEIQYMPMRWKLFFGLAKNRYSTLLYSMLYAMNYLRGK